MTLAIIELLHDRGRASWTEACDRARRSALDAGYVRAADTAYLRHSEPRKRWRRHALWTQGYLADGDPRRGERFTREATMVRTALDLDGSEPILRLLASLR